MSQVSEAIQEKRQGKKIDNLPEGLDANDPLVQQAQAGQGWGAQDQARYDKLKAGQGKERAQNYQQNPNNTPKTSGDARHQSMNQNANQDNDATSTVTGDNNTVRIDQDNSVRQYGGVNKSFTYNGGNGNNYQDAPVSMGTMAGYFYDEDTPAKSAAFVDRYTTMNDDYQKKYKNSSTAQDAINAASKNEAIDFRALDQKINDRSKASRARSTVMAGDIFGDMFNYSPDSWKNADKMEEVEAPDFKKLGKI